MKPSHDLAYDELQSLYDQLMDYLDSVMLEPEEEYLMLKSEQLGEKIRLYNVAILEKNSRILVAQQHDINTLIEQATSAKKALQSAEDKVKILAQVAKGVDKVVDQLTKWL
ncbi:hypothetical protein [Vibrio harveyi]|uniref:Uncharacterized protein n=1 Tax=Vibrio harveyi TaxID=669 RepID=A0A8B3DAJ6_VIBHA|nr:hypothetical protein [Vibrio harveyi]AWB02074.1 hypothetical protein CU052_22960 [Vibrio harveyi]ELE7134597.1 hypothetical protein [Vibrio harveyi]RIV99547.1 hypothetical protein DS957_027920 [Vibrio harveyi]CAK6716559.1 conserved hypothetical protein [Vibrio harveyi]HDM8204578.1 hypothetical protein [Vibrio harveyi]